MINVQLDVRGIRVQIKSSLQNHNTEGRNLGSLMILVGSSGRDHLSR